MFWNSTSDRCNMLQLSTEILYWSLVALTANTICVMHGAWTRRTTHANADLQLFDGWLWWESLEKADAKQSHTFERQQEMARRPEFAWCITHHHTRANQPIISPFEGHTHTPMQMLSRIRLSQSPTFWPTLHPRGVSENALTQYVHILLRCMPSVGVRCLKYDEDLFKVRMWWHHVRVDQTPGSLHRMKTTPVLWCAHGWTITNTIANTQVIW